MIYFCCDEQRRNQVRNSQLNGIDYLEVVDRDAATAKLRQRQLIVHFLNGLGLTKLTKDCIRIEGGERIRGITVESVAVDETAKTLTVTVDQPGDFSTYTLRLIGEARTDQCDRLRAAGSGSVTFDSLQPPDDFDPILSAVDFSFKVECPSDFDCKPRRICPTAPLDEPEIDYLAKDYGSFRQLLLDRMAVLLRQKERNPADLGVALVELLAYVGDYLSYQQDAIATEAYLGTARRRVSVRRHARLVDYAMHDGCNARAWVQVRVYADTGPLPKGTKLLTRIPGQLVRVADDPTVYGQADVVFETMYKLDKLYADHNQFSFYTWSDGRCCLPKGATRATLAGHYPNLKAGDVLIFAERLNPDTGQAADANPKRRHAVRLTHVTSMDQHQARLRDPLTGTEITEIEWSSEDKLPFPFCISARTDKRHGEVPVKDVSVALGNVVLADHGLSVKQTPVPNAVPDSPLSYPRKANVDRCECQNSEPIPARYRPRLLEGPLTHAAPFDEKAFAASPAASAMRWDPRDAYPVVSLIGRQDPGDRVEIWEARRDLLSSHANDAHFVVETEDDGTAYVRFGDNRLGKRPEAKTTFDAICRIGNGASGNIGAETLVHIVTALSGIESVSNPLPAQGGVEPESLDDVRQRAPSAFRITQERAVTPKDYAEIGQRFAGGQRIQRAEATFRWTGSWHTVFLTVDPYGQVPEDEAEKDKLHDDLERYLERYRMAGHDVEIDWPRYVALEIEMRICVKPDYFRSQVKEALLEVFSNRILPDGRRGVFHPDHFTFGQTIYRSRLEAAAQAVPGVASVTVTKFRRRGQIDRKALEDGKLELNRLEIARCDNDPNFPENGSFQLIMGGGK